MKLAKNLFAGVFAALGTVLMIGALVLCFGNLNAPPRISQLPQGLTQQAQALQQAVSSGDFVAAGQLIYGQPDLGGDGASQSPAAELFWDAFQKNLRWEYTSDLQMTDGGYRASVRLTLPDIAAMAQKISPRARTLLEEKMAAATEMSQLYQENGDFLPSLIQQVLDQATQEAAADTQSTKTIESTVSFRQVEGIWWAIPDPALMKALSGPEA